MPPLIAKTEMNKRGAGGALTLSSKHLACHSYPLSTSCSLQSRQHAGLLVAAEMLAGEVLTRQALTLFEHMFERSSILSEHGI